MILSFKAGEETNEDDGSQTIWNKVNTKKGERSDNKQFIEEAI